MEAIFTVIPSLAVQTCHSKPGILRALDKKCWDFPAKLQKQSPASNPHLSQHQPEPDTAVTADPNHESLPRQGGDVDTAQHPEMQIGLPRLGGLLESPYHPQDAPEPQDLLYKARSGWRDIVLRPAGRMISCGQRHRPAEAQVRRPNSRPAKFTRVVTLP